jgi:hypothetical protein
MVYRLNSWMSEVGIGTRAAQSPRAIATQKKAEGYDFVGSSGGICRCTLVADEGGGGAVDIVSDAVSLVWLLSLVAPLSRTN